MSDKSQSARLLNEALKTLEDKLARKLSMKALRKAGRVIVKEAKLRVPVRTGLLKKSIALRAKQRRKRGSPAIVVGTTKDAPHAHLIERGHVQVGKRGKKFVAARPFLRPAFDTKHDEFVRLLGDELGALILNESRRLGKRAGVR